jgi:WD40 repeat protein
MKILSSFTLLILIKLAYFTYYNEIVYMRLINKEVLATSLRNGSVYFWNITSKTIIKNYQNNSIISFKNGINDDDSVQFLTYFKQNWLELAELRNISLNNISNDFQAILENGLFLSSNNNLFSFKWYGFTKTFKTNSKVNSMKLISKDLLACGSDKGIISLWNLTSGLLIKNIQSNHTDGIINSLGLLKDEKTLFSTSSYDRTIKLWNIKTGQLIKKIPARVKNSDEINQDLFPDRIECSIVLKNGALVTGSVDAKIRVWNIATSEIIKTLKVHNESVLALIELKNNVLASASLDKTIIIWNLKTNLSLKILRDHTEFVNVLAILSDKIFVSGSYDTTIKLWNSFSPYNLIKTLKYGHKNGISSVLVLNNETLLSASYDNTTKIWNTTSGLVVKTFKHNDSIISLEKLEYGLFATGSKDNLIKIWYYNNNLISITNETNELENNNDYLFCENLNDQIFCNNKTFTFQFEITCMKVINNETLAIGLNNGNIFLWNLISKTVFSDLLKHTLEIISLEIMFNKILLSSSYDETINVWNIQTSQLINTLENVGQNCLLVLNNGILVSGSKFWNISSSSSSSSNFTEITENIFDYKEEITAVIEFNNQKLIIGLLDTTIRILDLNTGKEIQTLSNHSGIINVLIKINNEIFASGCNDNTIKLWNLTSNELIRTLKGHTDSVRSLLVLNDEILVSGSEDKSIRIWNITNGRIIMTLNGHTDSVESLNLAENNSFLSGSRDKSIKTWKYDYIKKEEIISFNKTFSFQSEIICMKLINKKIIAIGLKNGEIILFHLKTKNIIKKLNYNSESIVHLELLNDNTLISGNNNGSILLWNITINKYKLFINESLFLLLLFNNEILASCSTTNYSINIWNTTNGQIIQSLQGHTNLVISLIELENQILVSSSLDRTIRIWNLTTGQAIKRLNNQTCNVLIKINNEIFASGCNDNTIKLWNLTSNELIRTLKGHTDSVRSLLVLNDEILVSGSEDKSIRIWNITNGQVKMTLNGHNGSIESLKILEYGIFLSGSKDKTMKLWYYKWNKLLDLDYSYKSIFSSLNHAYSTYNDLELELNNYFNLNLNEPRCLIDNVKNMLQKTNEYNENLVKTVNFLKNYSNLNMNDPLSSENITLSQLCLNSALNCFTNVFHMEK